MSRFKATPGWLTFWPKFWLMMCCSAAPSIHAEVFANAGTGQIDYTQATHQAQLQCKELVAHSQFAFTVVSATVIDNGSEPAHCRIDGLIPTEIRFEVNLPLAWNGRLYMYGNGGLAGTPAIDPGKQLSRNQALAHSFATAYTDTGHDRRVHPGGTFAHNNFHKLVDYGFRAVHLTVLAAKELANTFYKTPVAHSYWNGCSTGGRQAMISAQRFPQDFDGIIAGAPAADYSGLKFSQAWRVAAISKAGFNEEEVADLADRIYAKCDALDGMEDGLLSDPRMCQFDPAEELPRCRGKDKVDCYTSEEIDALVRYYEPVTLGDNEVYPAMPVGSEVLGKDYAGDTRVGWFPWLINDKGPVLLDLLGSDFFRYMVFTKDDPSFDWTEFDFQGPAPDNLAEFRAIVDALDTDLSRFEARGGKLLGYFGWADPDINPLTLLSYRDAVEAQHPEVDDFFRVFMMPGMFHCRGGAGPDRFDAMTPLIDWVEGGSAPDKFDTWQAGEDGQRLNNRPTCAHPKWAQADQDGFVCKQ